MGRPWGDHGEIMGSSDSDEGCARRLHERALHAQRRGEQRRAHPRDQVIDARPEEDDAHLP